MKDSEFAVEALSHFNSVNYQLRHFVNNRTAQYEQQLIENYSPAPKLVNESKNVVDVLADTFAAVFVEEDSIRPVLCQIYDGEMYDMEISIDTEYAALQSLKFLALAILLCSENSFLFF